MGWPRWKLLAGLQDCRQLLSFNQLLPCPAGWDISKRNTQVLIYNPEGHAIGIDSAHYEMLAELHGSVSAPTELFLRAVLASCIQQRTADMDYYVRWNSHSLTYLQYVLEATCKVLVSRRTSSNFQSTYPVLSQDSSDSELGSSLCWPAESALLLLDSFIP